MSGGRAEERSGDIYVGLTSVIMAVTDEEPRVLAVDRAEWGRTDVPALPFGELDAKADRTLELALRRWVRQQTGLQLGYVEQLYTFGDRDRADQVRAARVGRRRVLSIAYLALVREEERAEDSGSRWLDCYSFLPWEDWRGGRPALVDQQLLPALGQWVRAADDTQEGASRRARVEICFGTGPGRWDSERVLERYELLYEAELVTEAERGAPRAEIGSRAMAYDHRRILATALGRLRGKIKYRPVVFEMLPPTFTLLQLQRVVESLAGVRLHKQNFRRLLERGGLVEGTGRRHAHTGGRPAELFRFRREVLRERPMLGVGLPGVATNDPAQR